MAVNIFPLCILVLYISGTYSSGVNNLSNETDEIEIKVLDEEQSNNKTSSEYNVSNENMSSNTNLEDVGPVTRDKERESQFQSQLESQFDSSEAVLISTKDTNLSNENMSTIVNLEDVGSITRNKGRESQFESQFDSSEAVLISSQNPSSEVHQHFTQKPNSSTDLDKTTPFVSQSVSDTAQKSHLPGVVSTTTDSLSSLTRVTYTWTNKAPSDSVGASNQHFIQTKDKTPHSSITSDKATSPASNSRSETTLISLSVSNTPGEVSSTTDCSTSVEGVPNVTPSTVDKPSTMDSMEGSGKDSYTLYSSTDVSFSQSMALTSATPETPKRLLNTPKTSKVVIILAAIGGSLLVIVALLVYLKYRKKTGVLPLEYILLSP